MSRGDIVWSGHKHHHFRNHGVMDSELVATADEYNGEGEYDNDSEGDTYWVEEEVDRPQPRKSIFPLLHFLID